MDQHGIHPISSSPVVVVPARAFQARSQGKIEARDRGGHIWEVPVPEMEGAGSIISKWMGLDFHGFSNLVIAQHYISTHLSAQ